MLWLLHNSVKMPGNYGHTNARHAQIWQPQSVKRYRGGWMGQAQVLAGLRSCGLANILFQLVANYFFHE